MKKIDLEALSKEISSENPCGLDLDDIEDHEFIEFQLLCEGEPDKVRRVKDPSTGQEYDQVIFGKESDADLIIEKSVLLLEKSKDLRVLSELCCALVREDGAEGLQTGLGLINMLISSYWDDFYPKLIQEENNDPVFRVNALKNLLSQKKLIKHVKYVDLVTSKQIGKFKVIDIDIAQGKAEPMEGRAVPDLEMINLAIKNPDDKDKLEKIQKSFEASLEYIDSINKTLSSYNIYIKDEWIKLTQILRQVLAMLNVETHLDETEDINPSNLVSNNSKDFSKGDLMLDSRDDASRQLKRISDFLKKSEPAHPAPLLIDRAIKLLEMDFLKIIENLAPDAIDKIYDIGGIEKDEN